LFGLSPLSLLETRLVRLVKIELTLEFYIKSSLSFLKLLIAVLGGYFLPD